MFACSHPGVAPVPETRDPCTIAPDLARKRTESDPKVTAPKIKPVPRAGADSAGSTGSAAILQAQRYPGAEDIEIFIVAGQWR